MWKFISQNCPYISKGEVNFVDDSICVGYKVVIERDLQELVIVTINNTKKPSLLLVGSLLEALLYCFLKRNEHWIQYISKNSMFIISPEQWLLDYLSIFRRYFGIFDLDILPDYVVEYRNIIHPNAEIDNRVNVSEFSVKQGLIFLESILKNFEEFKY